MAYNDYLNLKDSQLPSPKSFIKNSSSIGYGYSYPNDKIQVIKQKYGTNNKRYTHNNFEEVKKVPYNKSSLRQTFSTPIYTHQFSKSLTNQSSYQDLFKEIKPPKGSSYLTHTVYQKPSQNQNFQLSNYQQTYDSQHSKYSIKTNQSKKSKIDYKNFNERVKTDLDEQIRMLKQQRKNRNEKNLKLSSHSQSQLKLFSSKSDYLQMNIHQQKKPHLQMSKKLTNPQCHSDQKNIKNKIISDYFVENRIELITPQKYDLNQKSKYQQLSNEKSNYQFINSQKYKYNSINQQKQKYQSPRIRKFQYQLQNQQKFKYQDPLINKSQCQQTIKSNKSKLMINNYQKKTFKNISKFKDFRIIKNLGQGKFGTVLLSIHKPTNAIFALKKVPKDVIKQNFLVDQFILELKLQGYFNHSKILKIFGYLDEKQSIYLVLEYMEQGTLFSYLKKKKTLTEQDAAHKIRDIAQAVHLLHKQGVAHRDIKPENIVMSFGVCKLCDFGWATICNERRKTYCGTFDYAAPQILQGVQYDMSVDTWCLGILAYELIVGKAPFYHLSKKQTMKKIINVDNNSVHYPQNMNEVTISFIESLIVKNPQQRMKSQQILNHQFLNLKEQIQQI